MHIYIFKICLIFENIDADDVFVLIAPPGNDEHVAYILMRCIQIKSRLVWPYVDREFTYQVGDLVVMGHFWKSEKTMWLYYLQRFHAWIYILWVQSFGGGNLDTYHWNEGEEGWTKEMEYVNSWPWSYYGDMQSCNPLARWMKVIFIEM